MSTASLDRPRASRTLAVVVTSLALAGCGLRLESEPPQPPVPDALEIARDRTATDAADIAEVAERAATTTPDPVAEVLVALAAASAEHAAALGDPYVPFPDVTPEPDASATPTPDPPPAGVAEVVDLLTRSADRALADADAVDDGTLSRLIASVALGRLLYADALAAAGGDSVGPMDAAVPELVPEGVTGQQVGVLVQSEDALGLAWEVLAARFGDEDRQAAATRATTHRLRSQDWAVAAGIAGTGQDPRRSTYALPPQLTDPDAAAVDLLAAVADLEADLAAVYLTVVADAVVGARSALVELALEGLRSRPASMPVPTFPALTGAGGDVGQS